MRGAKCDEAINWRACERVGAVVRDADGIVDNINNSPSQVITVINCNSITVGTADGRISKTLPSVLETSSTSPLEFSDTSPFVPEIQLSLEVEP